jgi:hypothetical protein
MSEHIGELKAIASELTAFHESFESKDFSKSLERLREAAEEVSKSWSRSCIGYHANVYYDDLNPPPPGRHFNSEWGFNPMFDTSGEWREFKADTVEAEI